MSFFKKAIAQLTGSGGTTIDTRLESGTYNQGDIIRGELFIKGGELVQELDDVFIGLMTNCESSARNHSIQQNYCLKSLKIEIERKVHPGEEITIPFELVIPENTPVTIHKSRTWVHTSLEVESAVDPTDKDFIRINPSTELVNVIESLKEIGFQIRECENKLLHGTVVQEFEFYPVGGVFRGKLDELEMNFIADGNVVNVYLQVDRKARSLVRSLHEHAGLDETNFRITFTKAEVTDKGLICVRLAAAIENFVN